VRAGINYYARRIERELGAERRVGLLDRVDQVEQLADDLERVAERTHLRRRGVGFADSPVQRQLLEVGLRRGLLRAYVLYRGDEPIAFWLCSVYRGRLLLKTTGYDPDYARVGTYLLMRVIEQACGDPAVQSIDFGPGDADYKRMYGARTERQSNGVIYAGTLRARWVALVRTLLLGSALVGRRVSDAAGISTRLRGYRRARS
jgi:CelD/BcsL family acetyltransferase involved in cellulose biosynthesis